MLYNHSSSGNGTDGDGGGAWCSIWAQQRARASRPCCPPLFQPFWPPGCQQPLPGRSRPWTHRGPAAPWLSAGPGARTPPQLAGLGKGPSWAVRPFLRESGCPGVSLPSHPQGGQVLKKVGGGGWGHWVPTEMDPLGQGRSSGALLMESALGLQRPAAEPGDTGPLDLKQGPQMANHLSGGQFSFLMMPEGSPFLPSPLSSLFPSYPSPLISRSPILGSLAAGWLHKAAWPSRAGRGVCPSMLGQQGAH